jgi:predicted nucleic acid-binding protein
MSEIKFAVDTNILIYLFDNLENKKTIISEKLIVERPVISAQVISEFINVLKRKNLVEKSNILSVVGNILNNLAVQCVNYTTIKLGEQLVNKYQLQVFDAIIVASALESNCEVLYSEDLQHSQTFEGRLRIINPYL